jgi:hypothetical protein
MARRINIQIQTTDGRVWLTFSDVDALMYMFMAFLLQRVLLKSVLEGSRISTEIVT